MPQQVWRTPQARADLSEIASYLAQDSLSAALRFLEAAETTFADLASSPELGTLDEFRSPRLAGVRRWRIRGFNSYLVFYRALDQGIEVIRVFHGARDIEALFKSPE